MPLPQLPEAPFMRPCNGSNNPQHSKPCVILEETALRQGRLGTRPTCYPLRLLGLSNIQRMAWDPLVQGKGISYLIPLILGLMVFTRYHKGLKHLARIPLSMVVCTGAAIGVRGAIDSDFTQQIRATIGLKLNSLDSIIVVVGCLAVLAYSALSNPHHLLYHACCLRHLVLAEGS